MAHQKGTVLDCEPMPDPWQHAGAARLIVELVAGRAESQSEGGGRPQLI